MRADARALLLGLTPRQRGRPPLLLGYPSECHSLLERLTLSVPAEQRRRPARTKAMDWARLSPAEDPCIDAP